MKAGNRLDTAIIMFPENEEILEESLTSVLDGEDNGFLDKMFNTQSRLSKDAFSKRMLIDCYSFL